MTSPWCAPATHWCAPGRCSSTTCAAPSRPAAPRCRRARPGPSTARWPTTSQAGCARPLLSLVGGGRRADRAYRGGRPRGRGAVRGSPRDRSAAPGHGRGADHRAHVRADGRRTPPASRRTGRWGPTSDSCPGSATLGSARRSSASARAATRACGGCWCRPRTTSSVPSGPDTDLRRWGERYAGTGAGQREEARGHSCREAVGGAAARAVEDRRGLRAAAKRHGPRGRVAGATTAAGQQTRRSGRKTPSASEASRVMPNTGDCDKRLVPPRTSCSLAAPPWKQDVPSCTGPDAWPIESADRSSAQAPLPDITSGSQRPGGAPYPEEAATSALRKHRPS